WITPCKRSAARGSATTATGTTYVVQPKTFILAERVELLCSSLWEGAYYSIPRAALHLPGVIHVKVLRT
ncbi:MAG: hypothetical protein LBK82_10655, partial [Planctomycetaceae bacterium]|nr:hypothetical protein [Planctomycetaceae bacterium]